MEHAAFSESGGMVMNYADMPEALVDTVFPAHFGLPVGMAERERVLAQFGVYSKRMKRNGHKEGVDDSADKDGSASVEAKMAVSTFLSSSYDELLRLNNTFTF